MATAKVVSATQDGTSAYLSVSFDEGPPIGNVEYRASTPLHNADGSTKPAPQVQSELIAAVKAQRAAQLGSPQVPITFPPTVVI